MRPSKPSGMPMTFHPYLRMAALVAARMTALRPGASPPPVAIPIQRMSDIGMNNFRRPDAGNKAALPDDTVAQQNGNLRVAVD
jgi:hypothetical protein